MPALPRLAFSVRQPWAWAIIHAGKDVENRSAGAIKWMRPVLGGEPMRIAVHASKGLTRDEYEDARDFMAGIGVTCPPADMLLRGGIIGSIEVGGLVDPRNGDGSKWWMGGHGLKLRHPEACTFRPVTGALGLFAWKDAPYDIVPKAAKWMTARPAAPAPPAPPPLL